MNKFDFLVRFMPIYVNFLFGLVTLFTLKRDFITITVLLFLNENINSQFKNEMIPALYVWVVPPRKRPRDTVFETMFIPSFHCQYIWFINCVLNHYIKFYGIGDLTLNQFAMSLMGMYVMYNRIRTNSNTYIQTFLGMILGVCYGFVTTNYVLYLEPAVARA